MDLEKKRLSIEIILPLFQIQPEEISECRFIYTNKKHNCDEKTVDIPEEVTGTEIFAAKEFSEIFRHIEYTMSKMLEADPNLERSKAIYYVRKDVCLVL